MPLEPSCPVSTLFLLSYWLVHKASPLCCWYRCYHIFKLWTTCKEILGSILCLSPRSSLFNIWCYLQGQARIFSVACSVETPLWSVLPTGLSSNTWEMFHLKKQSEEHLCMNVADLKCSCKIQGLLRSRPHQAKKFIYFQHFYLV